MELEETKTGFEYLLDAYRWGGPFMHIISVMAVLMLAIVVWKTIEIYVRNNPNYKKLDFIIMAGSVSAAIGIFSQIVGIVQALEAIRAASDISPEIVMGGAIVSFYAPIWGFFVFIISLLPYFILKEIVKHKKN